MDGARPGPATDTRKAVFVDSDNDDAVGSQPGPQALAKIEDEIIDAPEDAG